MNEKINNNFLSPFSLFKKSWQIYQERFFIFSGILLIPFLFNYSFSFLIKKFHLTFIFSFFFFLFSLFLNLWSRFSFLFSLQEKIGVWESYKKSINKIFSFVWLLILISFLILGGIFFFLIPGILFWVWFFASPFILVSEDSKGFEALLKSKEYVKGFGLKVFFSLSFFLFLYFSLMFIFLFIGHFLFPSAKIQNLTKGIISIINFFFVFPFYTVYQFLIYQRLKNKKGEIVLKQIPFWQKGKYLLVSFLGFLIFISIFILVYALIFFVNFFQVLKIHGF